MPATPASALPPEYQLPADYQDVKLSGGYFGEMPYVTVDTCDGVLRSRAGRRMVALVDDFLLGFREALQAECGPAAGSVLASCGKRFGRLSAKQMEAELTQHYGRPVQTWSVAMYSSLLGELFAQHGWGLVDVEFLDQVGLIHVSVSNPIMAGIMEPGQGEPVEDLMAGYLAGLLSHFTGQELACAQIACVAQGAPRSRFIITIEKRLKIVEGLLQKKTSADEILAAVQQAK